MDQLYQRKSPIEDVSSVADAMLQLHNSYLGFKLPNLSGRASPTSTLSSDHSGVEQHYRTGGDKNSPTSSVASDLMRPPDSLDFHSSRMDGGPDSTCWQYTNERECTAEQEAHAHDMFPLLHRNDEGETAGKKKSKKLRVEKHDPEYMKRREKNNKAAKRSREKKRMIELQKGSELEELRKVREKELKEAHRLKQKALMMEAVINKLSCVFQIEPSDLTELILYTDMNAISPQLKKYAPVVQLYQNLKALVNIKEKAERHESLKHDPISSVATSPEFPYGMFPREPMETQEVPHALMAPLNEPTFSSFPVSMNYKPSVTEEDPSTKFRPTTVEDEDGCLSPCSDSRSRSGSFGSVERYSDVSEAVTLQKSVVQPDDYSSSQERRSSVALTQKERETIFAAKKLHALPHKLRFKHGNHHDYTWSQEYQSMECSHPSDMQVAPPQQMPQHNDPRVDLDLSRDSKDYSRDSYSISECGSQNADSDEASDATYSGGNQHMNTDYTPWHQAISNIPSELYHHQSNSAEGRESLSPPANRSGKRLLSGHMLDPQYVMKRHKNNEAARKSRHKKQQEQQQVEQQTKKLFADITHQKQTSTLPILEDALQWKKRLEARGLLEKTMTMSCTTLDFQKLYEILQRNQQVSPYVFAHLREGAGFSRNN